MRTRIIMGFATILVIVGVAISANLYQQVMDAEAALAAKEVEFADFMQKAGDDFEAKETRIKDLGLEIYDLGYQLNIAKDKATSFGLKVERLEENGDRVASVFALALTDPYAFVGQAMEAIFEKDGKREEDDNILGLSFAFRYYPVYSIGFGYAQSEEFLRTLLASGSLLESYYEIAKEDPHFKSLAVRYAGTLARIEPVMGKFSPRIGHLARLWFEVCGQGRKDRGDRKQGCLEDLSSIAKHYGLEADELTEEMVWTVGALNRQYLAGKDERVRFAFRVYRDMLELPNANEVVITQKERKG